MSTAQTPPTRSPYARGLARMTLAMYPAAWRARYGDEVCALLDDSGASPRAIISLAWHAIPAWVWPARHLYDRPARMRASLATVLVAWTVLSGLALVFTQLTQGQGLRPPGHPIVGWSYWVFDGAVVVSVTAVVARELLLWLLTLRSARREHGPRDMAYLLSPGVAPAIYLAAVRRYRQPHPPRSRRRPAVVPGLRRRRIPRPARISAAGPGLALRQAPPARAGRQAGRPRGGRRRGGHEPRGRRQHRGRRARPLRSWGPGSSSGYREGWPLGIYLPMVLLAAAVATVSAARGIRAARPATAA